ncbi:amp-dependent synthetase and ligase, partial [Nannochloropsis gaditana CCMP526]|uniref:amp-dependent synthetase and ligase n=1 Tax=Nannochloropsis gaditana (strain CCMP526) TaxID=1093141 RepID=UPI00029F57FB
KADRNPAGRPDALLSWLPFLSPALTICLFTFPLPVTGRTCLNSNSRGTLNPARCRRQCLTSSSFTAPCPSPAPSLSTTTATTFSPNTSSGMPTTAADSTQWCICSTPSTSEDITFSAPVRITSANLPTRRNLPSGSIT